MAGLIPIRKTFMWARRDENGLLLREDTPVLFELNEVASDIWDLIDGSRTVSHLVAELGKRWDAETETLTRDVSQFLAELERNHLIELKEAAE